MELAAKGHIANVQVSFPDSFANCSVLMMLRQVRGGLVPYDSGILP